MDDAGAMANAGAEIAKTSRAGFNLIDRVFGPLLTRRQAGADAQAEVHMALANRVADYIESNPLDPNVLELLTTYGGKASIVNLVNILSKAGTMIDETIDPAPISDDWIANWRDKARLVSDEEMATLWAQLLAGEAGSPGTYSLRSVNMLAEMDRSDAQLFGNLCRFQVIPYDPGTGPRDTIPLIFNSNAEIYASNGVTEEGLQALEGIGLIKYPALPNPPDGAIAYAYGRGWLVNYSGDRLNTGRLSWTHSGKQMSKLCLPLESPEGFEQYLLTVWREGKRDIRNMNGLIVQFKTGVLRADLRSATASWLDNPIR